MKNKTPGKENESDTREIDETQIEKILRRAVILFYSILSTFYVLISINDLCVNFTHGNLIYNLNKLIIKVYVNLISVNKAETRTKCAKSLFLIILELINKRINYRSFVNSTSN